MHIAMPLCLQLLPLPRLNIVVVAVKERKSNCSENKKEVIKIVAEYKGVSILVAISKRRKSNCSGLIKP
jgi:hypothetical protein